MINSPLQYIGRTKYTPITTGSYGPTLPGTKRLPAAPELYAAIGTTGGLFNSSGVPQELTYEAWIAATDNLRIFFGSKGSAIYSADQTAKATKIDKVLGISTAEVFMNNVEAIFNGDTTSW